MSPWAALLIVVLGVAPNGSALQPALGDPEVTAWLPVEELVAVLPPLYVVYHDVEDWPRTLYLPAAGMDEPLVAMSLFLLGSRFERLLPGLQVPRLFLYAPHYREAGQPRPVLEMPLDVASDYFNALIIVLAGQRPDLLAPLVARRAAKLMAEAPPDQRAAAYLAALADFGAHLLATAAEIRRSLERQRAAGKDPCLIVDHPATLFGLWGRIFTELEYFGFYRAASGEHVRTRAVLAPLDKELFVARALGGRYTGDVRRDFGLACP